MAIKIFDFEEAKKAPDRQEIRKRLGIVKEKTTVSPPDAFLECESSALVSSENNHIRSQAEEEAIELIQKIVDSQNRLEQYKKDVEKAKNIKNSFFYRSKIEEQRRVNEQNLAEILRKQNELIQGGIVLTIRTIEFASYLGEALSNMLDDGFRARDGRIMRLSGQVRKMAEQMLLQVEGQKAQLAQS